MRPTALPSPHQSASPSNSRPASRANNVATSSNASAQQSPARTNNKTKRTGTRGNALGGSSTADASSPSTKKKEVKIEEASSRDSAPSVPGLITLTKPLAQEAGIIDTPTRKQRTRDANNPRASNRKQGERPTTGSNKAKGATRSKETKHPDVETDPELLSRSAPLPSSTLSQQPHAEGNLDDDGLTWQQKLLGGGSQTKGKLKAAAKREGNRTVDVSSILEAEKPLNWQQELFGATSKAQRGPAFDVFADARDAETFGGDSGTEDAKAAKGTGKAGSRKSNKGKKAIVQHSDSIGDLSVEDVFNNPTSMRRSGSLKVENSQRQTSLPTTPAKKVHASAASKQTASSPAVAIPAHLAPPPRSNSASDDMAYAGPDFHNSPSAASLPAPRMRDRSSKSISSLAQASSSTAIAGGNIGQMSASTSNSSASEVPEEAMRRSSRGVTAPAAPEQPASAEKPATIENLLARLMR